MTESAAEPTLMATTNLLTYYNFQDESQSQEQLLARWLQSYPTRWVRLALIEALYQGRYKSISVELLLQLWQRRGQPIYHFNGEFEALVCHNVPQTFMSLHGSSAEDHTTSTPQLGTPQSLTPSAQTAPNEPKLAPIESLRQRSLPSRTASKSQTEVTATSPHRPSAEATRSSQVASPTLPASTPQSRPETASTDASNALKERQRGQPKPPTQYLTLVNESEIQDPHHPVDWLTAELEMAAVENVQALVAKHAQQTGPIASPILHFTPTAPATGLYTRLAAIANTR